MLVEWTKECQRKGFPRRKDSSVTVMFAFNAAGSSTPPLIVYPLKRVKKEIINSLPEGWSIGMSDISLYPNSTRIIQPCDVSTFKPIKDGWKKGIIEWRRNNPTELITKEQFAPILKCVLDKVIKPEVITNGFRACGIFPWNPNNIDFTKCLGRSIAAKYRQVLGDQPDQLLQRILWRFNPSEEIRTYELKTVIYDCASASLLATRVLKQLAIEKAQEFPIGSKFTQRDFYVDALLTGADTISDLEVIFREENELLKRGGFELRKWACSDAKILTKWLPNASEPTVLNLDKDSTVKTLGLQWNSANDSLQYAIPQISGKGRSTKRSILSQIAKIFDSVGLIGPVIKPKILMQTLWQMKVSWDEILPLSIHTEWINYQNSLSQLNSITISRNVVLHKNKIELHGFSDASKTAYGACIYVQTISKGEEITSALLCSKSRVAPLKPTTIPRLELCAALLLARLMNKVKQSLGMRPNRIQYWTASTIVLAWINSTSKQLKTFVANRVGEIQETTEASSWHHIPTQENPADLLSRGTIPQELTSSTLWWQGPARLLQHDDEWPQTTCTFQDIELPERRKIVIVSNVVQHNVDLFHKFSTFIKLQRVLSFVRRFIHNALCQMRKTAQDVLTGPLSTNELYNATKERKLHWQKFEANIGPWVVVAAYGMRSEAALLVSRQNQPCVNQ
ncbi:Pao retrotransposon peptidase [Popillia japonica]|uniref:Pao retrotransposon peptidase n=1 Tax=Popillia japonica TaxID=7064 RepID=A0AAW1JCY1_POPJA